MTKRRSAKRRSAASPREGLTDEQKADLRLISHYPDFRDSPICDLYELAMSLNRDGYLEIAAGLARWLLGESPTLESALGLTGKRGRPKSSDTADKDVLAIKAWLADRTVRQAADASGLEEANVRKLWGCKGSAFKERWRIAFKRILLERHEKAGRQAGSNSR